MMHLNLRSLKYLNSTLALLSLMVAAPVFCNAQIIDGVVAVIGTNPILLSEVENQSLQYKTENSDMKELHCQTLEALMTQTLLVHHAQLDSIVVGDDEIENELNRRIRYFSQLAGGTQRLEEYYGKSILEIKEEFRDDIKDQLLAQRKQQEIIKDVKVTPTDVRHFFNSIPKDSLPYYNAEIEVGEIVIKPSVSPEVKMLAKDKTADLRKRVLAGEDFKKLAILYSEDPGSRENGGELGITDRGELDPAFEAAAYALKKPGDVSEVVESSFGYHIIQLIERRGERINVRHILIIPKTTSFDLNKASAKIDSIHSLLTQKKMTFNEAAAKFSQDENTRVNGGMIVNPQTSNTYFDVEQLGQYDPQLALAAQKIEPGMFSEPQIYKTPDGKTQYRIIYVKSKTKAHQANLADDYAKIQFMAERKKQNEVLDEWLKEHRAKNFIHINSDFADCNNLKKWIHKTND